MCVEFAPEARPGRHRRSIQDELDPASWYWSPVSSRATAVIRPSNSTAVVSLCV